MKHGVLLQVLVPVVVLAKLQQQMLTRSRRTNNISGTLETDSRLIKVKVKVTPTDSQLVLVAGGSLIDRAIAVAGITIVTTAATRMQRV